MELQLLSIIGALFVATLSLALMRRRLRAFTTKVFGSTPMSTPKRRLLVLGGVLEPSCAACKHFDLAAGQAAFKLHEAFFSAAQHLTPEQMGVADKAGRGEHEWDAAGPKQPAGRVVTRWSDYGACQLKGEGVHKDYSCKEYA